MPRQKTSVKRKGAYLTKQALVRATGKATRSISTEAMNIKGYVVQAENGWIVKIDNNGNRKQITRIKRSTLASPVVLD